MTNQEYAEFVDRAYCDVCRAELWGIAIGLGLVLLVAAVAFTMF